MLAPRPCSAARFRGSGAPREWWRRRQEGKAGRGEASREPPSKERESGGPTMADSRTYSSWARRESRVFFTRAELLDEAEESGHRVGGRYGSIRSSANPVVVPFLAKPPTTI